MIDIVIKEKTCLLFLGYKDSPKRIILLFNIKKPLIFYGTGLFKYCLLFSVSISYLYEISHVGYPIDGILTQLFLDHLS